MASPLNKRQGFYAGDDGYDYYSWWFTPAGQAVKYSLWAALVIALLAYFIGGRIHAQRRLRKGLPPLAYHRWLVSRHQRARFEPQPALYQPDHRYMHGPVAPVGQTYGMTDYAVPPPAYNHDVPPSYQPPPGASKVDPQQVHVTEVYGGAGGSSSAPGNSGLAAPGPIYNPGYPVAPR